MPTTAHITLIISVFAYVVVFVNLGAYYDMKICDKSNLTPYIIFSNIPFSFDVFCLKSVFISKEKGF